MSSIYRNGMLYGGSESHLDGLDDVTITSPAEGDLLQYDATEQKWVNNATIPQKVAGLQKTGCVNIYPNDATSMTKNGVTYTVNSDLSVLLNGTPTVDTWFFIGVTAKIKKGKYKLVGAPSGAGVSTYYLRVGLTTQSDGSGSAVVDGYDYGDGVILDAQSDLYVRNYSGIFVWAGVPVNNALFKPMITPDLSATYADYQPYSMTNRELTEEVADLSSINALQFMEPTRTADAKAYALTLSNTSAVLIAGNGSGYTGDVPADSGAYKTGFFLILSRGTDRNVFALASNRGIASARYADGAWSTWKEMLFTDV